MKFKFSDEKDVYKVKFVYKEESDNPFFDGSNGEVLPLVEENTILLGLGDRNEFTIDCYKKAIYKLGKFLSDKDTRAIAIDKENVDFLDKDFVLASSEALKTSTYKFDHYKKDKCENKLEKIYFSESLSDYEADLDELIKVLDAQFFARDLVNLRSNDLYPKTLAKFAEDELTDLGVKVKVYKEEEIREMGLTAYLEVARGSEKRPRLIVMEYMNGDENDKPLALVGKGITYDTGGYSLKDSNGMKLMNSDMGGAGTVIGAMKAIASNKVEANVVAVVAACENNISGDAYKPGDIITARNGMTIEVDNTDAEGRITLADAVNYAATEYDPAMIVDLATLTGAVLFALGETYTGSVTNNQEAFDKVNEAAKKVDEKIWQLPVDDTYKSYNKSEVADIKNSGGRLGGSITAGLFVGAFVEDKPWVHLDIAGTAYLSKDQGLYGKGATGVHVKTLYQLAKDYI